MGKQSRSFQIWHVFSLYFNRTKILNQPGPSHGLNSTAHDIHCASLSQYGLQNFSMNFTFTKWDDNVAKELS